MTPLDYIEKNKMADMSKTRHIPVSVPIGKMKGLDLDKMKLEYWKTFIQTTDFTDIFPIGLHKETRNW